ncbi:sensor domain-containing phosphodiesterase [Oceanospirillum sediminis]|uniref:EAL domain-containing protein n=1 Tax=Oceanospirillum sediminis TaxID=2760088 RepID=A0A839IUA9_9GAMM|nr:EAL domain-containing protein [Oceanospirillum sediminis]MBB1488945.1 EAL domain-containing protein [Oceanospirillum sediminis]
MTPHLSVPEQIRSLGVHPSRISHYKQRYQGRFAGFHLDSHYQPIISLTHQRVVGYEALMRASQSGTPCSPLDLFARCKSTSEISRLDRLSRALHLLNFKHLETDGRWLFLNIRGEEIREANMDASQVSKALARHGFRPEQIVLEILEDAVHDEMLLAEFVQAFRNAGFLVAIDDFGTGQSNFDRIWKINPNIVKLDRSMIRNAQQQPRARRIFPRLVSLLRETESLVLIEGIENEEEALLAMDTEADMVQGYFFARPGPYGEAKGHNLHSQIADLTHKFAKAQKTGRQQFHSQLVTYESMMTAAADLIRLEHSFEQSCQELIRQTGCRRVFLLDEEGYQVTGNMESNQSSVQTRYQPLQQAHGANWARRKYFQRAIEALGQVYVSRPYLALPDANIDVTFSMAFKVGNETYVLCCDVDSRSIDAAGNLLQQGELITHFN